MPYLILLRHGESQWNLENRFTGWVDVPLTPRGEGEARTAGEHLRDLPIDKVYTSVLQRAIRTAEIALEAAGKHDLPTERDQALNERHYGDLQGLNKAETAAQYGDEQVKIWRRSYDVPPPGEKGESLKDTAARTLPYFQAAHPARHPGRAKRPGRRPRQLPALHRHGTGQADPRAGAGTEHPHRRPAGLRLRRRRATSPTKNICSPATREEALIRRRLRAMVSELEATSALARLPRNE